MNYKVLQNCTLWVKINNEWVKKLFVIDNIISGEIQDLEIALSLQYIEVI